MNNFNPVNLPPYWAEPIIPLAYSNAITYLEQVRELTKKLNETIGALNTTTGQVLVNKNEIAELQKQLSIVNNTLKQITDGEWMEQYQQGLATWIDNNLQTLVGRVVKYVMFGLTEDGHFCAYIPPSWDFLRLDTCMDYKKSMYGHLILRW